MKNLRFGMMLALLVVASSARVQGQTTIFFADFETDQSTTFTVKSIGSDFATNFTYDYSTHVQATGSPVTIGLSPSSPGSGTRALRMEANIAANLVESVAVYPNPSAGLSQYTLTFDTWLNNNLDGFGAGTSEYLVVVGHSDAAAAPGPAASVTAFTGFFWAAITDGDTGDFDYRFYTGTGGAPVEDGSIPNWNGADERDGVDTGWTALFPAPPYQSAGNWAKAWITVEQVVDGNSVTISVTPTGGTKTQVASFSVDAALTSGHVGLGWMDIFSASSPTPNDSFGLVDNVKITVPPPVTGAKNWVLYE